MKTTPEVAFGHLPLKGATPAAWQSQLCGVTCLTSLPVGTLLTEYMP